MRRLHYGWVVAGVTWFTLLAAAGFRSTPGVLIVPLQHEFGWSRATISIAVSINLMLFGLFAPFAGGLMERFGVRPSYWTALGHDAGRDGYLAYLKGVRDHIRNLEAEATRFGIVPADIPRSLGRPTSSLPKMIDEYYWITLTRGHVVPDAAEFARWYEWSR